MYVLHTEEEPKGKLLKRNQLLKKFQNFQEILKSSTNVTRISYELIGISY